MLETKFSSFVPNPLVSILINNYNYGQFLGEAIDSALNQTYSNVEVIVVDDGSTDNSPNVISGYGDRIISIFKENGGQASAFNVGFLASKGEIICILDSDDAFDRTKVEKILEIFQLNSDIGWCYHPLKLLDYSKNTVIRSDPDGISSHKVDFRQQVRQGKLPYFVPATSGLCFQRSLLQQLLPMPVAQKISLGDHYIKFTALALSSGYFLNEDLAIQKVHENNAFTLDFFHGNKKQVEARILTLTAYWMRNKFPVTINFANKIFGIGLGIYWQTGGIEPGYKSSFEEYLSNTSVIEKIEIYLRAYYHANPLFLSIRRFRLLRDLQRVKIIADAEEHSTATTPI
ncbi:glycosyltransferase family 2 protein [Chroococcidiopsis thermalis]|uniref:Glycosyl transferase family 2 n=1 Tax=Chroococcidiopsis thermalis (strain PCC 7203) TaxID=251229 RepID=K9U2A1_CHRTP|nr:glycosyltransferase family 2 protein [Chroococcidiopsis thermalis]AFY88743.1 glycosyl transferase family 2 [Chroococcidiopsis thermalis PCC 7203]